MRSRLMGLAVALFALPALAADVPQTGDVAVGKPDAAHIRFTLITTKGYVGFNAERDWSVIAMQSRPPVTATAFQIPDPADAGTPESTNLIVQLLQQDAPQAQAVLASDDDKHRAAHAVAGTYKGWTTQSFHAAQDGTDYTILDARSPEADTTCQVRLAWPHLPNHDAAYDARMEATFYAVLDSMSGGIGAYALMPGEIVRRPQ